MSRATVTRITPLLVAAGLALTGCADTGDATGASGRAVRAAGPTATAAPAPSPAGSASGSTTSVPSTSTTTAAAPAGPAAPSLPPGDPGLDAPAVPDPGTAPAEEHHDEPRRSVPTAAMLGTADVALQLGGSWAPREADPLGCTAPRGAVAARTARHTSGTREVRETVSTHRDPGSADRAVTALADELAGCGWTVGVDPRLGSASVAATRGGRSLTAVAAEGVSVVLVGAGPRVATGWQWDALVDLAMGSSCPAAPDGCH